MIVFMMVCCGEQGYVKGERATKEGGFINANAIFPSTL